MSAFALVFFILATAMWVKGMGWGGERTNARFFSVICLALFMLSFFCFLISWKLACPPTDGWFNAACFKADIVHKAF